MYANMRCLILPCFICVALHTGCSQEAPSTRAEPAKHPDAVTEVKPTEEPAPVSMALTEPQKIELLIQKVGSMRDAVFIRNGTEHTPAEAAKHMRDKWQWKAGEIKTAADFIDVAASKSSITGKPYRIRYADGHEVTAGEFLKAELDKLN